MLKTIFITFRFTFLITFLFILTAGFSSGDDLAKDLLKYTNEYRKSKGLAKLEIRDNLNAIAKNHSEAMANGKRSFGHSGFDQRVSKVKQIFKSCTVAENVAYGANTAKDAFTIWKNSSGHRKNMLGKYRYIGIGTAKNKKGVIYYTEIFVN